MPQQKIYKWCNGLELLNDVAESLAPGHAEASCNAFPLPSWHPDLSLSPLPCGYNAHLTLGTEAWASSPDLTQCLEKKTHKKYVYWVSHEK